MKKINGRIGNLGNKKTMAQNLKRLLAAKGLNPHQFSEIMGFKYTTVMNWIKANTYPRIDKIEMMAQYFGVDKSDLVEEYIETNSILSKITKISSQLEKTRQDKVLNFAENEMKEQEQEKKKVISLENNDNILTEEELQIAVDQAVAFGGRRLNDEEKEMAKQLLRKTWEEKHGRR
ncbi:helix-turn-helix domain-containing protein [Lactococcus lactis]|uniref:helix-turn-helix domain-containing protein n=1 Tax=Lactococcus lactis TaxID=1358 RepID=UPI001F564257|nr:helix-turn-helix transcriptional regulator [Lactococcus lactis]